MKFYTVKQTADILGYSTNSIYKFLDEGRLKGTRGSAKQGRFRITHTSLEKFLNSPLPEDMVSPPQITQVKKENGRYPKIASVNPIPEVSTTSSVSIKIVRALIIVGLLLILVDLFYSRDFSLFQQLVRLLLMGILITLTYQRGGLSNQGS